MGAFWGFRLCRTLVTHLLHSERSVSGCGVLQALGLSEGRCSRFTSPMPAWLHFKPSLASACAFCTILPVLAYSMQSYKVRERRFRIPSEDPKIPSHYEPEEAWACEQPLRC